ncbi:MAG: hypothetical protein V3S11_00840 [Elusimicrobiota bacterium]
MATTVTKIQTLTVNLETKPGALAQVYTAFAESGINVISSWAFEMGPGKAQGIFHVADVGKAVDVLTKLGMDPRTGTACRAEGDDTIGVYNELLRKIAAAGVNLDASDAYGIGGKFAAVFFAEESQQAGLCKALGC